MEKENSLFNSLKKWVRRIGIIGIVIGVLALIRYMALDSAVVRWILLLLFWSAMNKATEDCKIATLAFLVEIPVNYVVIGFLFGYGKINSTMAEHWIGILVGGFVILGLLIWSDLHPQKENA